MPERSEGPAPQRHGRLAPVTAEETPQRHGGLAPVAAELPLPLSPAPCGTPEGPLPGPELRARAVGLFRAMGHEGRLMVLLALSRSGGLSVGELLEAVGGKQSALSHQLRLLKEARLVKSQRLGRRIIYQLHDSHVGHVIEDAIAHVTEGSASDAGDTNARSS